MPILKRALRAFCAVSGGVIRPLNTDDPHSELALITPVKDGEDTRSRMQRIALELFWRKGYKPTTTRDVAAALGVQQPSLYHHIKNKEELLQGICYPNLLKLIETAEAAIADVADPVERLRLISHVHLTMLLRHQREFSVAVMEARALSAEYQAKIKGLWRRYGAFFDSALDDAKAAGALRADMGNRYLFTAMMDMLNWCVIWFKPGAGLTVEDLDTIFISIYLHGAMVPSTRAAWAATTLSRESMATKMSIVEPKFSIRESHARLLDASCSLFARKGYFATSVREIAALAGLQKATIYHYISAKEDLIYQISLSAIEHLSSGVQAALADVRDPLVRMRVLLVTHVTCLLQHQNWHAAANEELHALTGERRAQIIELRDNYEHLVRGIFEEAQAAGFLRSDLSAKVLGLVSLGLITHIYPWYMPATDIPPAELGHLLSDLFMTGALVTP